MRRKKNEKNKNQKNCYSSTWLLLSWFSTAALFAGCGSTDTGTSGGGSTAESSLSGKLTLNGSTSMATVCQALGEVFHEQNPGVTVEKSGTGSGDASKAVLAGTALIGDLSRELKTVKIRINLK